MSTAPVIERCVVKEADERIDKRVLLRFDHTERMEKSRIGERV